MLWQLWEMNTGGVPLTAKKRTDVRFKETLEVGDQLGAYFIDPGRDNMSPTLEVEVRMERREKIR